MVPTREKKQQAPLQARRVRRQVSLSFQTRLSSFFCHRIKAFLSIINL